MKLHDVFFWAPMADGSRKSFRGFAFDLKGRRLTVAPINSTLCRISDYRTGLCISNEHTGDMREAAQGFADMVECGAYDLDAAMGNCAPHYTLNGYNTELTPEGEQTVIPGCEKNLAPGTKQLDLF